MSMTGNLKTMAVPDLLTWVSEQQKTGALVVESGGNQKRVYFDQGRVVASSSNLPAEFLSHFVLVHGLLEEAQLAQVMEEIEQSEELLGRYLLRNEMVSQENLSRVLIAKTREGVFDLFSWEEGDFRFEDDERLAQDLAEMGLPVPQLIEEGSERLAKWAELKTFIPNSRAIPVAIGFLKDPTFSKEVREILGYVDDNRSVREICLLSRHNEFDVSSTLVQVILQGRLKVVVPQEETFQPQDSNVALSTGITVLDSDSLVGAAARHLKDRSFEKVVRYLKAARSLEPDSTSVKEQAAEIEAQIEELLNRAGVTLEAVPELARSMDDLAQVQLSPEAGFLITRMDGSYNLGAILKITPLSPLETRLLVYRLLQDEHIRLK